MPLIDIDHGTTKNDGTGDDLFDIFADIKTNFATLDALQSETVNAGSIEFIGAGSTENRISAAIASAALAGKTRVYVPASMLPYNASLVSFDPDVQMVREGGDSSVWDVQAYGASGDGTTDDLTAIQRCADDVRTLVLAGLTPTMFFPSAQGYACSDTVTLPLGAHVLMRTPVIYTGSANVPALVYGEAGASGITFSQTVELRALRQTISDWANEGSIGIKLINCNTCKISIPLARRFTIGVQCLGDGQGFAQNTVELGLLAENKYALDLTSQGGAGFGFCNENLFLGGRLTCFSTNHNGTSRYGVRIRSTDAYYQNNNVFVKPCFELDQPGATPGEAVSFLLEKAIGNYCYDARDEGNSATFARATNASTENFMSLGFGEGTLDEQSSAPVNIVEIKRMMKHRELGSVVHRSGPLHRLAAYADGSTSVNVAGHHIGAFGDPTSYPWLTAVTPTPTYLETTRAIGIFVDTSRAKEYVVSRDVETGFGGRIYVVCFDAAGTILTSGGGGHPYVKGTAAQPFTWDGGSFGGSYGTGSDSDNDIFFKVHGDVKSIRLLLASGSAALRIRSFTVRTSTLCHATAWAHRRFGNNVQEEVVRDGNLVSAVPVLGTYIRGRMLWNYQPSAGGAVGWQCTTSGTMGTLNGGATTGSITSGTDDLVVSSATGLEVGQFITIAGVTGIKQIIAISGTAVTIDSNASATVSGAAVAFSTGVFTQFPAAAGVTQTTGTWTPTLAFGGGSTGITYSTRAGGYCKTGDHVTCWCFVALSNKGSSTGAATLTGLPFTIWNDDAGYTSGLIGYYAGFTGLSDGFGFLGTKNTTALSFYIGTATGAAAPSEGNFTNTSQFILTCTYRSA